MPAVRCEWCNRSIESDHPGVIREDGLTRHYRPWFYCNQECHDQDEEAEQEREDTYNNLRRL
jgi:hypothetical protein